MTITENASKNETNIKTIKNQDFKETEIGLIPEDWEVVRLEEVSKKMRSGGTPRRNISEYWGGDIPFVIIEDMTRTGLYLNKTKEKISEAGLSNSSAWVVPPNSLLLSMYATIGETAINKIPVTTNQAILAIIPNKNFNVEYGAYLLKFNSERLIMQNIQSTQKNVNKGIVKKFLIPLPPLPEQKQIAHILSSIQEAKEKTEDVINATKELKKSLMSHLFTYGPVPVSEAEHVKLKETEIGLIPEDWEVRRLGDVAIFKNGINFQKEQKGKAGVLTIDVLNMYSQNLYVDTRNLYRINKNIDEDYYVKRGDLLFVRSSLKREGVGWTSLVNDFSEKITFCGFIIRGRLISSNILPEYLVNYLRTDIARENLISFSGKVAITNINQGMLGNVLISLPPLQIQTQIVDILSSVDSKIEAEENKAKALDALFKTLLENLMTGKLRVNTLEVSS